MICSALPLSVVFGSVIFELVTVASRRPATNLLSEMTSLNSNIKCLVGILCGSSNIRIQSFSSRYKLTIVLSRVSHRSFVPILLVLRSFTLLYQALIVSGGRLRSTRMHHALSMQCYERRILCVKIISLV
jgi:hypothetical protein